MIKFINNAKKDRFINTELARKKSDPNKFIITDYKIILYYVNNPNVKINKEHCYLKESIKYYRKLNTYLVELYSKIINEKKFNLILKFERIKPEIISNELINQLTKLDNLRNKLRLTQETYKSICDLIDKNRQINTQQSKDLIKNQNLFYEQINNKQLESKCTNNQKSYKRLNEELKLYEKMRDTFYDDEINQLSTKYSRCMPIPKTLDEVFTDNMFILQDIYIISNYVEYPCLDVENQHEVYRLVINEYTNKMTILDNKGDPNKNLLVPFIPKCILNKVYIVNL